MAETSTKPYLVRALYEWCCDNGYTPYLAVTVDADTRVPMQYVKGGEIVLNISPAATNRLTMGNDRIEFQARFSGVAQQLSIPVGNVTAIYARETGHGMAFDVTRMTPSDDELAATTGLESGGRGAGNGAGAGRSDVDEDDAGGGAEVIAFGPDAAKRRRRPGGRGGRRDGVEAIREVPSEDPAGSEVGVADARPSGERVRRMRAEEGEDGGPAVSGAGESGARGHGLQAAGSQEGRGEQRDPASRQADDVDREAVDGQAVDREAADRGRADRERADREPAARGAVDEERKDHDSDERASGPAAPADRSDRPDLSGHARHTDRAGSAGSAADETRGSSTSPEPSDGKPEPSPPDSDGAGKGRRSPRLTRVK